MRVAPSVIAANFSKFQEEIKKVEKAGADLLHLDIMDGVFVPNITFGPMIVEAINIITEIELDAHLMIIHPEKYLGFFIDAGADWISCHVEATDKTDECITFIKNRNKKVGFVINPGTQFRSVTEYLGRLDFLLIMSVNPGFYGQKFIPDVLYKIEEAKNYIVKALAGGDEEANLVAELADKYPDKASVHVLTKKVIDKPIIRIASLFVDNYGKELFICGYFDYTVNGRAFKMHKDK